MKVFLVFSALAAVALAKPGVFHGGLPVAYAHVVPGAPIGPDGRVVDTPEVAVAKAAHTAAHISEKVTLANEAVKSADVVAVAAPDVVSVYSAPAVLSAAYGAPVGYARVVPGAPIGPDGRVVDTPEVAVAKAAHTAAHINEKVTLVNEAAKNFAAPAVVPAYGVYPAAPALAYSKYVL
ncbi:cuticle protein 18.7-like [Neodiprion pinetum]|uniref:cuticle protein 18.7-like n=1 Tax=Neodiprion pinetum TaxID=441929 RepID=UPI001EDFE479|nr:cuticle protein 18.7-like [Neodiprion pinetum]